MYDNTRVHLNYLKNKNGDVVFGANCTFLC